MTSPQQLEVLDLRHFSAGQLRPLLEQEAAAWERRLRWDYRSSTNLLLQYLDSRILPGFVAMDGGRICGYCFCVYEGQKAVVGDIFVAPAEPGFITIFSTLSSHLIELLESSPDIHRIEAQLLLFDAEVVAPIFASCASRGTRINVYPRLFLERALRQPEAATFYFPAELEVFRWSTNCYQAAAELIQRSYVGHLDAEINDQYCTLAGSQRFLHNIVRFPGCGNFDPEASFVLRDRRSGVLAGLILCSCVGPHTAHVTQLCLAPGFRGRGLGKSLLSLALHQLSANGYQWLTLTVSEANSPALRLYQGEGFRIRQRFDAVVLERAQRMARLLPFLHAR